MHRPSDIRRSQKSVPISDRSWRRNSSKLLVFVAGKYKHLKRKNFPKCAVELLRENVGKQTRQLAGSQKPDAHVSSTTSKINRRRKKVLKQVQEHIRVKTLALLERRSTQRTKADKVGRQGHRKHGAQKVNTEVQTDLDHVQMDNLLTSPTSHTAIFEQWSYLVSEARSKHLENQELADKNKSLRGKQVMAKDRQQELYENQDALCLSYHRIIQENGKLQQKNADLLEENRRLKQKLNDKESSKPENDSDGAEIIEENVPEEMPLEEPGYLALFKIIAHCALFSSL